MKTNKNKSICTEPISPFFFKLHLHALRSIIPSFKRVINQAEYLAKISFKKYVAFTVTTKFI